MAPTVADYLLERLRDWDVDTCSPTPATGSTASSPPGAGPRTSRSSSRPGTRRWPPSRPSGTPSSPARVGVCMATSGPGRDPPAQRPVRRQARPRARSWRSSARPAAARWAAPTSRKSTCCRLFKDVASEYVQMVTVPEQLPNVLDRAIRIALAERAPTAIIIPSDVQELRVLGADPRVQDGAVLARRRLADRRRPTTQAIARAAEILNAGSKVAILAGQGARGARRRARARSPSCSAPGSPSRCWARTCCPTSCRT